MGGTVPLIQYNIGLFVICRLIILLYLNWSWLVLHLCVRILENLKDYAARALVNAVDHLGTVAYKLSDILEKQTFDVSTMDLKVSTLNQVITNIFERSEGKRNLCNVGNQARKFAHPSRVHCEKLCL